MTHAGSFDNLVDLDEELLVSFSVFTSDENLQRNFAALQRLEMFSYKMSALGNVLPVLAHYTFLCSCNNI